MLDVTTGKSQLVIRDHGSLIKRSKNKYTELFGQFKGIDRSALCIGLDLIRVLNGNIYFSLAINYFGQGEPGDEKKHFGIWSVNLEKIQQNFITNSPAITEKQAEDINFCWMTEV